MPLGSRLADWIIEKTDYHVVGVDDLSGGYMDNVHEEVEFHQFDISIENTFEKLVKSTKTKCCISFCCLRC